MPDLKNPITGGVITVSDDLADAFISRGFLADSGKPAEGETDKPAKRGRPRKADADRD